MKKKHINNFKIFVNESVENISLTDFFENEGFNVSLFEQDNEQCAELEKWTDGGVDMIITLVPFSIEEFVNYVDEFNIDEEIDLHREDPKYKAAFTISKSLKDFTDFHNHLKDVVGKLEALNK